MMSKKLNLLLVIVGVLAMSGVAVQAYSHPLLVSSVVGFSDTPAATASLATPSATPVVEQFPGGGIRIEEKLRPGAGYSRYRVSYDSDGFKIYALMTVPAGEMPASGFPVIVFNHGYIPPSKYTTTGNYDAYVDAFARHGYIVFKSDYRGNGQSEGGSSRSRSGYVRDILNAVNLLKQHPYVDPNRIGMWGHSMGGYVTVEAMLTSKDIKAGVIWAGTLRNFRDSSSLKNLSGPLQLHHAMGDQTVPYRTSINFATLMKEAGLDVELYIYPGDNHNLTEDATTALTRSLYFFDKYVKNASTTPESTPSAAAGG